MSKEDRPEYKQPLRWEPPTYWGFKCDGCGSHMDFDTITVEYGFGSSKDMEREDFCSDECFELCIVKRYDNKILDKMIGKEYLPTAEPEDFEPLAYTELDED